MTGICSDILGGRGLLCRPFDLAEHVTNTGYKVSHKVLDSGEKIADKGLDAAPKIFGNIMDFMSNPAMMLVGLVLAFMILNIKIVSIIYIIQNEWPIRRWILQLFNNWQNI